jgi:hypothetical protein
MKILKIGKDKIWVELTRKDIDVVVSCLDILIEDMIGDKMKVGSSFDKEDERLLRRITDIEAKLIRTNLVDRKDLVLRVDE